MASTLLFGAEQQFRVNKSQYDRAERQYYESLSKESLKENKEKLNESVSTNNSVIIEQVISNDGIGKSGKGKYKKSRGKKHSDGEANIASKIDNHQSLEQQQLQNFKSNETKSHSKKNKNKNNALICTKHVQFSNETQTKLFPKINIDSESTMNAKNLNSPKAKGTAQSNNQCTLVMEIAKAREHIKNSLEKMDGIATLAASPVAADVMDRITSIEKENKDLRKLVKDLEGLCLESQKRIANLESQLRGSSTSAAFGTQTTPVPTAKQPAQSEDDDGVDLFASESDDEESAEAARIREERLAAYAAKKSKKPALIAKSSLILDVKPWDDETDLKLMETEIRKITCDGLLWGASKFVPVAYGIQKLSISCVVEDEKVSIDWLTEQISELGDYVQSVDVAAFNKI